MCQIKGNAPVLGKKQKREKIMLEAPNKDPVIWMNHQVTTGFRYRVIVSWTLTPVNKASIYIRGEPFHFSENWGGGPKKKARERREVVSCVGRSLRGAEGRM